MIMVAAVAVPPFSVDSAVGGATGRSDVSCGGDRFHGPEVVLIAVGQQKGLGLNPGTASARSRGDASATRRALGASWAMWSRTRRPAGAGAAWMVSSRCRSCWVHTRGAPW